MKKLIVSSILALGVLSFGASAQQPLKTDNTWVCNNFDEIVRSYDVFMMRNEKRREHYFENLYENSSCVVKHDGMEYYIIDASNVPFVQVEVWSEGEPYVYWGFAPEMYDMFKIDLSDWF